MTVSRGILMIRFIWFQISSNNWKFLFSTTITKNCFGSLWKESKTWAMFIWILLCFSCMISWTKYCWRQQQETSVTLSLSNSQLWGIWGENANRNAHTLITNACPLSAAASIRSHYNRRAPRSVVALKSWQHFHNHTKEMLLSFHIQFSF